MFYKYVNPAEVIKVKVIESLYCYHDSGTSGVVIRIQIKNGRYMKKGHYFVLSKTSS